METSITIEMISKQTYCGEIERPDKDSKILEVAKKFHAHVIRKKNKIMRELLKLSKVENI